MKDIYYILDCLMTDEECFTQIKEYFALFGDGIDDVSLRNLLNKMTDDKLIVLNKSWKNEHDEFPYALTEKGKEEWEKLHQCFLP